LSRLRRGGGRREASRRARQGAGPADAIGSPAHGTCTPLPQPMLARRPDTRRAAIGRSKPSGTAPRDRLYGRGIPHPQPTADSH
jgi:hypothetical protein